MEVLVLKKRKEFIRVAKGFKVVMPSLILQATQSLCREGKRADAKCCFLGYTATKKLGKAHIRNRTKRRLRAAADKLFAQFGVAQTDYVLIGRFNTASVDFNVLISDMKKALFEINLLLEKHKNNCEKKNDQTAHDLVD